MVIGSRLCFQMYARRRRHTRSLMHRTEAFVQVDIGIIALWGTVCCTQAAR